MNFLVWQGARDESDLPIDATNRLTAVTYPVKGEVDFVGILKRAAPNRWRSWFAIIFGVIPKESGIQVLGSGASGSVRAIHRVAA